MTRIRKRNTTKRKQKGGVVVTGVSSTTFPQYRKCHENDCVRSAFFELGMYDGTSTSDPQYDFIARSFPKGIPIWEIIPILNYAYRIEHFPMTYQINDESIVHLSLELNNGDAILAFYTYHMFIIFKESDRLFVRNPQAGTIQPIENYLGSISKKGIVEFSVISTSDSIKKDFRVPLHGHERISKIKPADIQALASEGLLPSYKQVNDTRSGWAMAASRPPGVSRDKRTSLFGGTRKRYKKKNHTKYP